MTRRLTFRPVSRPALLATTLALGLLAGCSSNPRPATDTRPAESGGTPAAPSRPEGAPPPASETPSAPGSDAPGSAGASAGKTTVYLVKDSGVRCIAAPCPSLVAQPVNDPSAEGIPVTSLDLSALGVSDAQQERLFAQAQKGGPGLRVEATVGTQAQAGPAGAATILRVNRVLEGR